MNLSKFQIAFFIGIFVVIVTGLFFFATYRGTTTKLIPVTMWGTVNESIVLQYINELREKSGVELPIDYVQMRDDQLSQALLEALAGGAAPDIILASHEVIIENRDKVFPIPYNLLSEQTYKETFIQGSELFLSPEGAIAMPFLVDPLVLYWNRNIFSDAGLTQVPRFWDELTQITPILTQKDSELNILKTTIALGEFANIVNAKEIIATLMMQAGTPIVQQNGNNYASALNDDLNYVVSPAESSLNFYTQFANPVKTVYSWNRSLPNSRDFFTSGDSAMYIGFGSEYETLLQKNPNLDIAVALLPQARNQNPRLTFGRIYSFAIVRRSANVSNSFSVIAQLTTPANVQLVKTYTSLPPAQRALVAQKPPDNAVASVLYDSAVRVRAWYDVNKTQTYSIFQNMVESITTGRQTLTAAINEASRRLNALLR